MDIKRGMKWHSSSPHGFSCISTLPSLLIDPIWVSFSTSMVNLPSAADGENPEKRTSAFSCIYCWKSFNNHRSLRGHLRSHNVQLNSAWRSNYPGSSSTSIGFTSTITTPLSNNQPGNSCEDVGKNLAFRKGSSSNSTILGNAIVAGSGSTPATGFPSDVCLSLGLNGVPKLSTDEDQTCQDGKLFSYGGALQNNQHNLSKPSFTNSAIPSPYPVLGSNQSPGMKESATFGTSFIDLCPSSGQGGGCLFKMEGFLTSEEGKRIYPLDSLGNTDVTKRSKRPKTVSNLPVVMEKPQIKELPLIKVMEKEKPFSALQISADAEQEVPEDIDLSLHL